MGLKASAGKKRICAGGLMAVGFYFSSQLSAVVFADAKAPELTRLRGVSLEKAAYLSAREKRVSELVSSAEKYLRQKDCQKFFRYAVAIKKMDIAGPGKEFSSLVCGRELEVLSAADKDSAKSSGMRVEALLQRAKGHLKHDEIDAAVETLEKAFVLDPDNAAASKMIDSIRDGFVTEARQKIKKRGILGQKRFAEYLQTEFELAEDLISQEMYMDARMILNRILLIDKNNSRARRMMRKLNQRVGEES